jgi:hypothetical protein
MTEQNTLMKSSSTLFDKQLNSDGRNHIQYQDVSIFYDTLKSEKSKILQSTPEKLREIDDFQIPEAKKADSNCLDEEKSTNC